MTGPAIVEGSACRKAEVLEYMTPDSVERMIIRGRETLSPHIISAMPLSEDYQDLLLSYSHFLSTGIREKLLLRLSGKEPFYAPLFYELCDRAGKQAKIRAYEKAAESGNIGAMDMLREALGGDVPLREKGFFARLGESLLGLAY